ncbi:hypothetical protein Pmani_026440 [Petrolisthes manimaculis]|uniref:Uncharacterized protein n=1 Tax=Petrolisthes manimaculis TaxID=1843537 RepID=A0AAE1P3G2_9EUCA|nr:hypothetical protein Pmani_026440 [Petrolisthes manimaculis]
MGELNLRDGGERKGRERTRRGMGSEEGRRRGTRFEMEVRRRKRTRFEVEVRRRRRKRTRFEVEVRREGREGECGLGKGREGKGLPGESV